MPLSNTNKIIGANPLSFTEIATPTAPDANDLKLYAKDDSGVTKLYIQDSDGMETDLTGGGSGGVTTFLGLTDTPDSYTDQANKIVAVKADESGIEFIANTGAVSSVFGRTGAVTAALNDYTWAQINKATSDLADLTTKSHTSLTDKGTHTHAEVDTHLDDTSIHTEDNLLVHLSGNESIADVKTFTSFPILPSSSPTTAYQAVHKEYADALAAGFKFKVACDCGTTAALAACTYDNGTAGLGATLTVDANAAFGDLDGYTVNEGDRVLVKDQVAQEHNGVYSLTDAGGADHKWVLTRVTDFDTSGDIIQGNAFLVLNGTTQIATQWALITSGTITVGTTDLVFAQISKPTSYSAGDGLDLTGTTFSTDIKANDGLETNTGELTIAYDDSSIGIVSNHLAVKGSGITNAMLAGSIVDTKLDQLTTANKVASTAIAGIADLAQGDLIYGSGTDTLALLNKNTTATRYLSNTGTSNNPAWAQVNLANGVTGSLPNANLATIDTAGKVDGAAITGLANVPSGAGYLPVANLGSGSPGETNYLRGDGSWAVPAGSGAGVASLAYTKHLTADVTATTVNTTTETTLTSYSVPANTLSTNRTIRVTASGTYTHASGTARTVTFYLYYGGTAAANLIASATSASITTGAGTGTYEVVAHLMANGATNAQSGNISGTIKSGATTGPVHFGQSGTQRAIDSTGNQTLYLRAKLSGTGPTLVSKLMEVELLNASDNIGAPTDATYLTTSANDNLSAEVVVDADLATFSLPANTTISTYAQSFLDDANESAFKATVNLEPGTDMAALTHAAQHAVGAADTIFPADPNADKVLGWDDSEGSLAWVDAGSGSGDVSAAAALDDNAVIRGDGGVKGVQDSGVLIDDSNNVSGVLQLKTDHIAENTGSHKIVFDHSFSLAGIGYIDHVAEATGSHGVIFDNAVTARINPRTSTVASSATPTIDTDSTDIFTITALAAAITSMTTNLSGTPVNGQKLIIRILDNGTARAITWGTSYASRGATLPTTTVLSKYLYVGLIYNSTSSKWECVAVSQEA